jgi:TRAP-type C4-dicarboxylate transport system permease small subunit
MDGETRELANPLAFPSIVELMAAILNMVIVIATPIIVLFIIIAGFKYVTAQGNPEKLQEANRALMYGIIGGVIIIGAVAILQIVQNTVNAF